MRKHLAPILLVFLWFLVFHHPAHANWLSKALSTSTKKALSALPHPTLPRGPLPHVDPTTGPHFPILPIARGVPGAISRKLTSDCSSLRQIKPGDELEIEATSPVSLYLFEAADSGPQIFTTLSPGSHILVAVRVTEPRSGECWIEVATPWDSSAVGFLDPRIVSVSLLMQ
jgi:hypothetical protein